MKQELYRIMAANQDPEVPSITRGGTGAGDAATARSNLGLIIGTTIASLVAGRVPLTELGGAGADVTKFLRGDNSWAVPPSAVAQSMGRTFINMGA